MSNVSCGMPLMVNTPTPNQIGELVTKSQIEKEFGNCKVGSCTNATKVIHTRILDWLYSRDDIPLGNGEYFR